MSCRLWRFMKNRRFLEIIGFYKRGSVSIESLATMLLLLLLGIGIFSLSITSTAAYQRIYEGKSASSEVRVALSFVQMKIRQNDSKGAIRIESNPINQEPSLVIQEIYDGETYETWIYRDEGKLREAFMLAGEPPSNDISFQIANSDGFDISMDDQHTIRISVWVDRQGKETKLESQITLRSE